MDEIDLGTDAETGRPTPGPHSMPSTGMSPGSRQEYERRMHRVLAHIDAHLAEPLDLPTLAGVAHFSAYHFHRLFAAWMGETLGDYLRRRRLERGAGKMYSQPALSVLQVAVDVGFGSSQAFSRAFKTHFGMPPGSWREARRANRNPDHMAGPGGANNGRHGLPFHSPEPAQTPLDVRLVERPPAQIVYLRHVGPYGPPVTRFWATKAYPWLVANRLLDEARYGIAHDDPSITDPRLCRYDACADMPAGFPVDRHTLTATLPGGRYAVLPFEGPVEEVVVAWTRLLRDWLPSSGLQLDERPCYEYYAPCDADDAAPCRFACDLCIPVAPL